MNGAAAGSSAAFSSVAISPVTASRASSAAAQAREHLVGPRHAIGNHAGEAPVVRELDDRVELLVGLESDVLAPAVGVVAPHPAPIRPFASAPEPAEVIRDTLAVTGPVGGQQHQRLPVGVPRPAQRQDPMIGEDRSLAGSNLQRRAAADVGEGSSCQALLLTRAAEGGGQVDRACGIGVVAISIVNVRRSSSGGQRDPANDRVLLRLPGDGCALDHDGERRRKLRRPDADGFPGDVPGRRRSGRMRRVELGDLRERRAVDPATQPQVDRRGRAAMGCCDRPRLTEYHRTGRRHRPAVDVGPRPVRRHRIGVVGLEARRGTVDRQ